MFMNFFLDTSVTFLSTTKYFVLFKVTLLLLLLLLLLLSLLL